MFPWWVILAPLRKCAQLQTSPSSRLCAHFDADSGWFNINCVRMWGGDMVVVRKEEGAKGPWLPNLEIGRGRGSATGRVYTIRVEDSSQPRPPEREDDTLENVADAQYIPLSLH
jgi:hypothetical protein